ncbi:hypothetical protein RUND412_010670 [Rhizina undulata]
MKCCGLSRFFRRAKKRRSTPSPVPMYFNTQYHRLDSGMFLAPSEASGNPRPNTSASMASTIPEQKIIKTTAPPAIAITIPEVARPATPLHDSPPEVLTVPYIQALFRKYQQGIPVTPTSPTTASHFFTDPSTITAITKIIEDIDAVAKEIRADVRLLYLAGTMVSTEYDIPMDEGLELAAKTLGIKREDEKGPDEEEIRGYGEIIRLDSFRSIRSRISVSGDAEESAKIGWQGSWRSSDKPEEGSEGTAGGGGDRTWNYQRDGTDMPELQFPLSERGFYPTVVKV